MRESGADAGRSVLQAIPGFEHPGHQREAADQEGEGHGEAGADSGERNIKRGVMTSRHGLRRAPTRLKGLSRLRSYAVLNE